MPADAEWTGPDDAPGQDPALRALHRLVPAAADLDRDEQAMSEGQVRGMLEHLLGAEEVVEDPEPPPDPPPED